MIKKLSFLIFLLCLVTVMACTTMPKIDPQMEKQVQKDAYEFEALLSKLITHVISIRNPSDVDIRAIFPDDWIFEETPLLYALGIPVPKNVMRGLILVRETDQWTYYMVNPPPGNYWYYWGGGSYFGELFPSIIYFNRGGKMSPDTDTYIVPTWVGQPYNWSRIEGGASDKRDYPRALNLGFFKIHKVVKQPYMIPPEATHGVYQEWRTKPSSGNTGSLAAIVRQMWDANPYVDKSEIERLKTPSISQLVSQLPLEIARVNDDVSTNLDFIRNLESKYFTPNSLSYNKQIELTDYRNSMGKIRTQLSQVDDYLQPIKRWDFSNLEKYRSLKAN